MPGDYLVPGDVIWSPTQQAQLRLQGDGNIVGADWSNKLLWSPQTENRGGTYLMMQWDGNLVLYKGTPTIDRSKNPYVVGGPAVWSSGTSGKVGAVLQIQDDGNFVIYQNGTPVWSAGSYGKVTAHPTLNPITNSDRILVGQAIWGGQSLHSPDGLVTLTLQTDGDLVLKDWAGKLMWHSATAGRGGSRPNLRLAQDGNIILAKYEDNSLVWSPQTENRGGAALVVQNDGNVVLYTASSRPVWATNTMHTNSFRTAWGSVGSWKYPNVQTPAAPSDAWYVNESANLEDLIDQLVTMYSHCSVFDIPDREWGILRDWALAAHKNHLFGKIILLPWTDGTSPDWVSPAGNWLIRRDDDNFNKDYSTLQSMFANARSSSDKTMALRPFIATQGKDWGTFGIEGFHIEKLLGPASKIIGSILMVIPGVGTAIGAGVIAAGQLTQSVVNSQQSSGIPVIDIGASQTLQTNVSTVETQAAHDVIAAGGNVVVNSDGSMQVVAPDLKSNPVGTISASVKENPVLWVGGGIVALLLLMNRK
jgi:hypothetical protein